MPQEWRNHRALQGRFHPDNPDHVQVIVHNGGPRIANREPELVWVAVTGTRSDVFTGKILNQPSRLATVKQGDEIHFIVPKGWKHPLLVTEKYLRERPEWIIHPCENCGLSELFDAPSDLVKATFLNLPDGAVLEGFTTFCGMCRGVQLIQHKVAMPDETLVEESPRRWWQFWK